MDSTSLSQVWGLNAAIRSTPPRRPSQPWPETRTSYQVGRPWMFDGKMLREQSGTPMRSTERANSSLALAEPEPLTLANLTTKSLVAEMGCITKLHRHGRASQRCRYDPGHPSRPRLRAQESQVGAPTRA